MGVHNYKRGISAIKRPTLLPIHSYDDDYLENFIHVLPPPKIGFSFTCASRHSNAITISSTYAAMNT